MSDNKLCGANWPVSKHREIGVPPAQRTREDWQQFWQSQDNVSREAELRAALDRINLGLHTSSDVALLRFELNL